MERAFPNQAEWTEWDLNPRLPPCEGGDHPLIYRPAAQPNSRHLLETDGPDSCSAFAFSHRSRSARSSAAILGPSIPTFARGVAALIKASATSPIAPDTCASDRLMVLNPPSNPGGTGKTLPDAYGLLESATVPVHRSTLIRRQEFLLRLPRTSRRCLDCHLDAPTTKNEERRAFIQDCTFTSW